MFKSKMKCIFCENVHSSVNKNCTIKRKKMKKQKKTTIFLFFYYSTFLFLFGSDSVFYLFENRLLTVSKPQFSISNVVKKKNTTNYSISTSIVFLYQLISASSSSSAFISIQFLNNLKKFKKTVFFIIFTVQKSVDI